MRAPPEDCYDRKTDIWIHSYHIWTVKEIIICITGISVLYLRCGIPDLLFWNWSIDCNPEMHWILFSTNCDYPKPNYLRGTIEIIEDTIYTSFLHCERKDQLYLNLLRILPTGVVSKKLIGALIIASNSRSCNIPDAVTEAMATDIVCTNIEIAKQ